MSIKKRTFVFVVILIAATFLFGIYFLIYQSNKTYEYNGRRYHAGESFKDVDGCNTCSFNESGQMQCTLMACDTNNLPSDELVQIIFSYNDGVYSYSGTIQKPTPCHEIKSEYVIRESFPEQVDLRFTVVDSGEICSQVIDKEEVNGQIPVSEEAKIQVYVNDELQIGKGVNE